MRDKQQIGRSLYTAIQIGKPIDKRVIVAIIRERGDLYISSDLF